MQLFLLNQGDQDGTKMNLPGFRFTWHAAKRGSQKKVFGSGHYNDSVDGWNPAPVDMVNIPLFLGFYTSQVVVWDFSHHQLLLWLDVHPKHHVRLNPRFPDTEWQQPPKIPVWGYGCDWQPTAVSCIWSIIFPYILLIGWFQVISLKHSPSYSTSWDPCMVYVRYIIHEFTYIYHTNQPFM